jgi:hypothetical protein
MNCACCKYLKEERILFSSIFVCDKCDKSQKGREVACYYFATSNTRFIKYVIVPMLIIHGFISPDGFLWIPIITNIELGFFIMPNVVRVSLPSREEVSDEILMANLQD